jgi:SHS2 domain-containing protein
MTMENASGFEEISHTADWAVRVWAPDFNQLLIQSARAMNTLTEMKLMEGGSLVERHIQLSANDPESLLVAFLNELLFLQQQEGLGFNQIGLTLFGFEIQAVLKGAKILNLRKEIKAVTFHNLNILETEQGVEATIVFDV